MKSELMMANFRATEDGLYFIGEHPRTREEAWDLTIEKWTMLSETPVRDGSVSTCGLCKFFLVCSDCPIKKRGCVETPYSTYVHDRTRENALVELEFLKGVRDGCR